MKNILFFDWDGTIIDSFSEAPNGMSVHKAYDIAIEKVFGKKGKALYEQQGGLHNREPKELVIDLVKADPSLAEGKTIVEAAKELVREKLSLYQIDNHWPLMYPGAQDFFAAVASGELPIDVGIVSSGHTEFITEVFKLNGLKTPKVLVTSDDLISLEQPRRPLFKPYTYAFAIAHRELTRNGSESFHQTPGSFIQQENSTRPQFKARLAYVGDDPVKDGGLAETTRIPFLYMPNTRPGFRPNPNLGQTEIRDFAHLHTLIKTQSEALLAGKSWSEVLLHRPDNEIFPPLTEEQRPYAEWLRTGGKERF